MILQYANVFITRAFVSCVRTFLYILPRFSRWSTFNIWFALNSNNNISGYLPIILNLLVCYKLYTIVYDIFKIDTR